MCKREARPTECLSHLTRDESKRNSLTEKHSATTSLSVPQNPSSFMWLPFSGTCLVVINPTLSTPSNPQCILFSWRLLFSVTYQAESNQTLSNHTFIQPSMHSFFYVAPVLWHISACNRIASYKLLPPKLKISDFRFSR